MDNEASIFIIEEYSMNCKEKKLNNIHLDTCFQLWFIMLCWQK